MSPGLQRPPRFWQKLPEAGLQATELPNLQPQSSVRHSGLHQTCEHFTVSDRCGESPSPGNRYAHPFPLIYIAVGFAMLEYLLWADVHASWECRVLRDGLRPATKQARFWPGTAQEAIIALI